MLQRIGICFKKKGGAAQRADPPLMLLKKALNQNLTLG
jgi:hypothetical protein